METNFGPKFQVDSVESSEERNVQLISLRGIEATITRGSAATYRLINGECTLSFNDTEHYLMPGHPVTVPQNTTHIERGNGIVLSRSKTPLDTTQVAFNYLGDQEQF